jgi:hypothetical protein
MIRASEFNLRDPDLTCNQSTADLVDAAAYTAALNHPAAVDTFHSHFDALIGSDTVVLVLPCGRSAHTELGGRRETHRDPARRPLHARTHVPHGRPARQTSTS